VAARSGESAEAVIDHVADYNLRLVTRLLTGAGTPRELWAAAQAWFLAFMLPDGGLIVVPVVLLGEQTAVLAVTVQLGLQASDRLVVVRGENLYRFSFSPFPFRRAPFSSFPISIS
jgi:hypothetical protein